MVAMSFNAQQYSPSYGGGNANLPPGKYKVVIAASEGKNSASGNGGASKPSKVGLASSGSPLESQLVLAPEK